MKTFWISGLMSLLIVFVACKSGNQEVTSENTGDSTIVVEQPASVKIDSANVERGVKKPMSKAPDKTHERKVEETQVEQRTVYAHIYLDQSGNREDVEFPNPLGYGLEEEVLRVIKAMPKFIPAEDQGEPVKTKLILPVKFYLKYR